MTANLGLLTVAGLLAACGVYLLLERSLTKMLLGLLLFSNGVNILIITAGGPAGNPPIVGRDTAIHDTVADPLAQAMILTAIVITMGIASFVLALAYRSFTLNTKDDVENDPEDTKVSRRRSAAEAPDRDRSDDPVTGEPSFSGDAFDSRGNPIPLEEMNAEDYECYERLHGDDPDEQDRRDPDDGGVGKADDDPDVEGLDGLDNAEQSSDEENKDDENKKGDTT